VSTVVAGVVATAAVSPAASEPDPTIVVHGGGIRGAGGTVGPVPAGAVFTAMAVGFPPDSRTCTMTGTGTCSIAVPPGRSWDVTETTAPAGHYLNPKLDSGSASSVSDAPYTYRTATLFGTTVDNVPGSNPNDFYGDFHSPPQTFSGLLATSVDNPPPVPRCGLNIAIVLDQSNSMADGDKQATLKAAANDAITALTGTPSTVAIYTFGSGTGPSVGRTSTIDAASAQPLHDFIDGLPVNPSQVSTNWDRGLDQVGAGFDEVIFLTDGAPTLSRIGGDGTRTSFADTEQGIFSANRIRASGTRIVGVGVGLQATGGADNLRAVTGPTQNLDYFLSNSSDFGDQLTELATGECSEQLTITKLIEDPSGALISPTPVDANGWTFTNTISAGSTIGSPTTTGRVNGVNGVASAAVTIPAGSAPAVTVTETVDAGYTFVAGQCSVSGRSVPTTESGTSVTFRAVAAQPLVCTFTNRRPKATPSIATAPTPGGPIGTSISDTATLSGGFSPGGTVTFSLFPPSDPTCGGTPVFTSTDLLSNGAASSGSFTTAAVGVYRWVAAYSGDVNDNPVTSGCQAERVTATRAVPTLATTPSPGGPSGILVSDAATVSGGFSPTGTVTFALYPPGDVTCSGTPEFVATNPLSGGGGASSGPFTSTAAGIHRWVVIYNGDANNAIVSSGCQDEPVVTTRATPTIATVPSASGPVGIDVFDTATVSGGSHPTGTVTFSLFAAGDVACRETPVFTSTNPLSGSSAGSGSFTTAAAGTYRWVATYNGDADNLPVGSGCQDEPIVIGQAQSVITTVPSAGGPVGTAITDTATLSGGFNPTGTVTFALFEPGDAACAGPPLFTSTNPLSGRTAGSDAFVTAAVGEYRWIATYNGDANNAGIASGCQDEPVTVTKAAPSIATTPSAGGPVGTAISDTATLSGGFNPTGTVTFELFPPGDSTCGGTPAFISTRPLLGGVASSGSYETSAAGTYHWAAIYNGDVSNTTVSSGCQTEPVTTTPASLTITTVPSAGGPVGATIFDTATVNGGSNPTGTVTFALYPPADTACAGVPVFTSANPLSGGGASSDSFTPAVAGTYRWIATYGGDADNAAASSGCQDEPVVIGQVQSAVITTRSSAGGPVGTVISDTATVTGGLSPTGTVSFALYAPGDVNCTGTPVFSATNPLSGSVAGSGPFTTAAVGIHRWVARYSGDANNAPVSSGCRVELVTITRATPSISTAPSAGGAVGGAISDAATVSGGLDPTGSVTFALYPPGDVTCTGTPVFSATGPLSGNAASSGPYSTTAAGTHRWVVTYSGDASNTTARSGCQAEPVTTSRATPAVASVPSAGGRVGITIFDTATVTGGSNPTGSITFQLFPPSDAACSGTPVFTSTDPLGARSVSSGSFATTTVGTYRWIARYSGDANNAPVASGCQAEQVVIGQAQSAVITTVPSGAGPVGTAISDTATMSGGFLVSGQVTFRLYAPDDPTCSGSPVFTSTSLLNDGAATSASFATTTVGTYRWVATYNGDLNNAPVASGCGVEPVTITRAAPTIVTTPAPSGGGPVGASISDTATVSGGSSPAGSVTFALFPPGDVTCAGTPVFVATNPLAGDQAGSGPHATAAVGTYRWVATYGGDAANTPASSGCGAELVTVTRATPSISTTPSGGGPIGTSISDAAAVGGGFDPTGSVRFALYPPLDVACAGVPIFTSSDPLSEGGAASGSYQTAAVGTYRWVATYGGDANNDGVSSGCADEAVTATRATPAIDTVSSVGGPIGTSLFDTATVTGGFDPTGMVTFALYAPGDPTCSGSPVFTSTRPLSGSSATSASFATDALGIHRWIATYAGDASNAGASSGCHDEPELTTRATPTIDTNPSAGGFVGTPTSDTAAVGAGFDPTGAVTFELFGPGDDLCGGTPVFTSTNPLSGGSATSDSYVTATAGAYRWVATYSGDVHNTTVSGSCQDEIVAAVLATPTITNTPSPGGLIGTSITDTATLGGGIDPTGAITFELFAPEDTSCAGPPIFTSTNALHSPSATSDPYQPAAAGTYRWVATYGGDANNAAVSSRCQDGLVTIVKARPVLVTTPSGGGVAGTGISDAAVLTGGIDPTGTISFGLYGPGDRGCANDLVAGNPAFRGVPLSGSTAVSPTFTTTAAGVHQWVAAYSGDARNEAVFAGCGDPSEQVATTAAPALPPTGAVQPVVLAAGTGLAAAGALLLVPGRRRRRRSSGRRKR